MRAQIAAISDGIPMELSPLLLPYGRDRRVTLRIERMPLRARLSRGRNNGDGSWSLTRDEIEGLEYLPPKGATENPTLTIRVIGIDSDNGATLSVLDFPVQADDTDAEAEDAPPSAARRDETRNLRNELSKVKAALRLLQSEFDGSRKSFDAELEERLNEAATEAATALEERRAAWQAEMRDRITKAEARAQERLDQTRKRLERDAEATLSRAEEAWKSAEAARTTEAEARWREQSARALAKEAAQLKKLEAELADARSRVASRASSETELRRFQDEISALRAAVAEREKQAIEAQAAATNEAREQTRRELSAALSQAEQKWKAAEDKRLAAAETAWKEFSDRTVAELARRLEETETELDFVRAETKAAGERRETVETKRLRNDLSTAQQTIAQRDKELAAAKTAAEQALRRADELTAAAGKNESAEIRRLRAEIATAQQTAALRDKEIAEAKAAADRATKQTEAMAASAGKAEAAETRRLRAELATAQQTIASRDKEIADAKLAADQATKRTEELSVAVGKAEALWKKDEAKRLAAAELRWSEQSAQTIADMSARLQRSEAALAKAQAELKSGRRDDPESRRLKAALAEAETKLSSRNAELAELQTGADDALARARQEFEHKLAEAREDWAAQEAARLVEARAEWKTHSDRMFKQATIRLEGAEAALAEARNAANTAQDRREGADLKRLRAEFATARENLAEREAELAEAKVALGRERERNRSDVEAALAKAEETTKAAEAVRVAEVETRERERGARALAEAMGRLERTEAALNEMRVQRDTERERSMVMIAETRARLEKTDSALQDARNQIETMRDPASEAEQARLRADLAALQVVIDDRDAELAEQRSVARRSRDEWNTRIQAAVMRARDEWRAEEESRLKSAHRQWETDARLRGSIEFSAEGGTVIEEKEEKRLAIDIVLASALAVLVVIGFTFYPQISAFVTGRPASSPIGMTRAAAAVRPDQPVAPALPHGVITVSAVKLRETPSADAHVIATIERGTDVTLMGQSGSWTHVQTTAVAGTPARDGWIHASSLKQTPAAQHKS